MATRATVQAVATAITLGAALAAPPAAAQVSVEIGGQRQDVPANTVRTVTTVNGRTSVIDVAWRGGEATPGMAAITTTETTDEDGEGHVLSRTIVTRIEPQRAAVVVVSYAPPPAPRIEIDPAYFDEPVALGTPHVMRISRDSWGGHFVASMVVNGVPVRAIIDSGAAYSILSAEDARATGADRAVQREEAAIGIGGYTRVGVARVASVEIGGQSLGRMTMRIGQPGMPYTLLGQSEIARLGRVTIEDGVMTITPRGVVTQVAMK
ncbi:retropepsin-like aspartic protease family protein [Sphingomonas montana]|uniref:retropepsin-like aspartic protease family protein n=1 Tax=Sphingomonas montana TaxID=1843236 RepID=UPI00101AD6A8|nr:retropepsin-like aspartic protease [Sphingomonas montana]